MRFLCMCVVILISLVAVQCFVSTPNTLDAAANILRGVLANDEGWILILFQILKVEVVDFGTMLADLKLTYEPDTGITTNDIIQRLVTHKGTTGSQLMYGIRVLGISVNTQFMITLMVHFYLASKFAERKAADPASMRVCISKMQMSIVNFTNKVAFFGHPIDTFRLLNDKINEFLKENNEMLNSKNENMPTTTSDIIVKFFSTLFEITKEKVQEASYYYDDINDEAIQEIMVDLKLVVHELDEAVDIKEMDSHILYSKIMNIEDYKHINVSSVGLDFIEERFNVQKYIATAEGPKIE